MGCFALSNALHFILVISVLFSIVIASLWEEEAGIYVLFEHLFVYCAHVNVCPFSLPLDVGDWLRQFIVALPERFY